MSTPEPSVTRTDFDDFDQAIVAAGTVDATSAPVRLESSPLLASLLVAGTTHIYADTADRDELVEAASAPNGSRFREVDGNTVNQPLAQKVLDRYLGDDRMHHTASRLRTLRPQLTGPDLAPYLYAVLLGWIGNDGVAAAAGGRAWEVSLQLHMGLAEDATAAMRQGRQLRRMVPTAFVKVPFLPHAPACFLVARDLEREGIPVNLTSTFSVRQAMAAALLADVSRTNIFMGRLNQGLQAQLVGEHVDLKAQRALIDLRRRFRLRTRLIVASMREWQTFVSTAGCDIYTAPPGVLRDFLEQREIPPAALTSQLETSYADRLGIPAQVTGKLGTQRIGRLWRVEPEFVEFLVDYRTSPEYRELADGDRLWRRFEDAGFGDVFHAPGTAEWTALRKSKLPDLEAPLTSELALDTLYSLLADADFKNLQDEIDAALVRAASR